MLCENLKTSTTAGLSSKSRQLTPNGRGFTSSNFPPPKYNIPRLARDVSVTQTIILLFIGMLVFNFNYNILNINFSLHHHMMSHFLVIYN